MKTDKYNSESNHAAGIKNSGVSEKITRFVFFSAIQQFIMLEPMSTLVIFEEGY